MSYILDALRRADAERERGAVPGLQSQQHAIAEDDAFAAPRSRALLWAVVALTIALVALLAWQLFGGGSAPRPVVEGSVTARPVTPAAAPPPPALTVQDAAPPAAPPAPAVAPPEPVPPRTTAAASAAVAVAPRSVAHAAAAEPKRSVRRSVATSGGATQPAARAASAAGESRIYSLAELPEDVRRDLPKLVIGGASYSGDAASRMVMINGQIFHEGDDLGHGLVLERIKLKSAILAYKGYRYEMTF